MGCLKNLNKDNVSRSNFMVDYKIEDCKDKLSKLSKEECLRLIYTWVKQDYINLKQFKVLVVYCG